MARNSTDQPDRTGLLSSMLVSALLIVTLSVALVVWGAGKVMDRGVTAFHPAVLFVMAIGLILIVIGVVYATRAISLIIAELLRSHDER